MTSKKTDVIVNGKEIDLTGYFETLAREPNQSEFYTKIGVSSYQEIGYLQNSILSVCRQALETGEQIADGLDFSRLSELVQKLIPYAELELLNKIQQSE
ncbi:hypothetical protein CMT56_10370 [Elizabethkingia anophelis]|uniref:hypothetical protein n=1 Tax=Elizabethkingia anophelis TaxID=1117645 RepID=UPI0021A48BF2|nr:hypothetical protein [Elizabethkingia anophelis]MCT4298296.1 hypothetical protein [Elizabethkingia anophelis]MCT4301880.1 hypothetical protein [Elizabethkingia anophelis]MDV3855695.1 hypothetical protein [Elizabethkingia anophelis]MDV3861341.1 hypothetical protein [Elizabethkingia anophelis]